MKQTILITGASSGFGLLLATRLHESGYNVIGTSRNPEKTQTPFKMLVLDIADETLIPTIISNIINDIFFIFLLSRFHTLQY